MGTLSPFPAEPEHGHSFANPRLWRKKSGRLKGYCSSAFVATSDLRALLRTELQEANERSNAVRSTSRWIAMVSIALTDGLTVLVLFVVLGIRLGLVIQELKQGAGEVANAAAQISAPASRWA